MGCYDTVLVKCPNCGTENDFQSKSGECLLNTYKLEDCPTDVMYDINRHSPCECYNCSTKFEVKFEMATKTCPCCKNTTVEIIDRKAVAV